MSELDAVSAVESVSVETRQIPRIGFWIRQFALEGSVEQKMFDVMFGALAPLLCLALDPVVFRAGLLGRPVMEGYAIGGWLTIVLSIVVFLARDLVLRPSAFVAGMLAGGAAFAFVLGAYLFPMSLIGLVMIIGIFGFTPFVTALVFARNAVRTLKSIAPARRSPAQVLTFAVGFTLLLGVPAAVQSYLTREVSIATAAVLSDDPQTAEEGVRRLVRIGFFVPLATNTDEIVWAYQREGDEVRRERFADAYERITRQDIDDRLRILED